MIEHVREHAERQCCLRERIDEFPETTTGNCPQKREFREPVAVVHFFCHISDSKFLHPFYRDDTSCRDDKYRQREIRAVCVAFFGCQPGSAARPLFLLPLNSRYSNSPALLALFRACEFIVDRSADFAPRKIVRFNVPPVSVL